MKRASKFLLIACAVVGLLIVGGYIYLLFRPPDDGRTPAERRQIADACFAILHSSLTNEPDPIKMDDPRSPEVIRALHPIGIIVAQDFSVQIARSGKPEEYFLVRLPHPTNTWILCIAGPSVFGGGGREILRIEHD